ncbi:hypothetical protein UFOVP679_19 [uncultured Caudovirales phage]|uniref:Uncharacterized protein n=1 Tax=uncultured Caudovirales phage TaxID=2100421 RepID=A0A6J5NIW5_9CAUD|nr:hypothetical protein UFOVP679_19 [uncultured Caudovirales phage]
MTDTLIPERLERVTALKRGNHDPNDDANFCVMEAVAYVAGEPWSDHPKCTCPVITAFMVSWNDSLDDADRTRLLAPLIPHLIGTRGSKALQNRRATMATDWYVRVQTPAWLRLAGLAEQADALASFPEITDFARTPSLMPVLNGIRKDAAAACAAWDAARDAAWAAGAAAWDAARAAAWAAGAAAWDAARDDAWDAARDAARAAGAAAWDAAGDAWDAARDAAGDAARAVLKPTVTALQASAVDLVIRMCALKDEAQ